ncbi:matrilin-3a isoform X4 [Gadus morhua]|uniref:matrilin-3a isoform X4 n=1 Tax=Gadus morhua TaxID=8049 RepID=UPI0011B45AAA|nr:leucine-rich repeat extensin-like protein 2 isoform X4 [Gadus morhua]
MSYFSCVYCALLLLSGVLGTYPPSGLDLHHITAQSYAQTRNIARPPHRTLNPSIHGSDYRYRGYHYHHQPPRIPPPVVYHPIPLSPPVTYHHRHSFPMPPPYHHFNGAVAPQWHNIHRAHSPPVVHHHRAHHPFPAAGYYRHRAVCPSPPPTVQPDPTVAAATSSPTPVVYLPTTTRQELPSTTVVSQATVPPTLPVTTLPPVTTSAPMLVTETTEAPVGTPAPVMLPVSTPSGSSTSISPVETGVDPCAMGHHCDHICVNSNASYYCKCRNGYILNTDKKTCSMKQVKAAVVQDPCKCEARLAFQRQTQSAIQQLAAKLSDVTGRVKQLESALGRA